MILKGLKPRKALNKAFLKVKPNRTEIERFKANLITLLDHTNDIESEEFHKNLVSEFLKKTYYDPNHFINTKERNDLVIHNSQHANSTVGVIIEAKKPTNKAEMMTTQKLNSKALQELVLYYLRERITHRNLEVKNLVATNIYEWFIFDASVFDRLFAQNKQLVKQFIDFEGGRLANRKTDFFYKHIAEPFIDGINTEIEFTYFNFQDYQQLLRNANKADDTSLIALFKLLSPEHLLKLPFTNDSNSLDKRFYSELLHIIGLTETKEGSKKIIERNKEGKRNPGSLLENAIIQLDSLDKISRLENTKQFGTNPQERLFNVGLELCITWINRILFLKLLEAQLITYHKEDKAYEFLNFGRIHNFDALNKLFFQVLAKQYADRTELVQKVFEKVPYLNSSLFEPSEIEHRTLFISNLEDDYNIPIFSASVLKDDHGRKRTGDINTLQYLFEFLSAYDFASEGSEEIQENNKTLISASVLGLIFEKINGYKDGSFFTPGFITMYMCRESIRKAVVQKFNETATPLLRGAGGVSRRREIIPYNPKLKELARELRNNSTKSEIILWKELKGKFEGRYDFHRQKPLDNYIADFFCYELKLVIEIDGETHNWDETQKKDFEKESRLNELGLNVLHFPDSDIFRHLGATVDTIKQYIIGFEKGDLSEFKYDDTPLNPLSRGDFALPQHTPEMETERQEVFMTLDDIYEQIGEDRIFTRQKANQIINSIKICDLAVGSGHFLVSGLNEIIAIKNDLKILQDRAGRRLKEYHFEVVNDELIVTDEEGALFEYNPKNNESQRVQETLFHEKQTIIENCLFGVDINPNSVKICRLRLWIELLKNAYYITKDSSKSSSSVCYAESNEVRSEYRIGTVAELQTLPNIDINIKCGNSLVSRFAIDADLKQALKKSKWTIDSYQIAVDTYRNAESKEQKREMEHLIADIKSNFRSEITRNDPKAVKLRKLSGELFNLTNQQQLFQMSEKEKLGWEKKVQQLTEEIKKLESEIEAIKANKIFENAFEWRFEFPEALNDEGDFVGFDVVIGNPPYIRQEEFSELKSYLLSTFVETGTGTADLFVYFIEQALRILKPDGEFSFIVPNKWMRAGYGKKLRQFVSKHRIHNLIDFGDLPVFEEATTYPNIIQLKKCAPHDSFAACNVSTLNFPHGLGWYLSEHGIKVNTHELSPEGWSLSDTRIQALLSKIKSKGVPLREYVDGKIFYGIKTGLNEAFVIDKETREQLIKKDPKSVEVLKPLLAGRDIKRYQTPVNDKYLILFPKGFTIKSNLPKDNPNYSVYEPPPRYGDMPYDKAWNWIRDTYPAIARHLAAFRDKAEARYDKGDFWWELRACDYYDEFEKPKIIYPNICRQPEFTLDENFGYTNQKCFIITHFTHTFLGILNSKLFFFLFKSILPKLRGDFYEPSYVYFKDFPIVEKESSEIDILTRSCLSLKKQNPSSDTTELENRIDQLVYKLYDLTEEEIEIVERK